MVTTRIQSRNPVETGSARFHQPVTRTASGGSTPTSQASANTFRDLLGNQASNRDTMTPAGSAASQNAPVASTNESEVSGLAGLATNNATPSTGNDAGASATAKNSTASDATAAKTTAWTPANSTGPHDIPTAEELFGDNPWLENPTGYAPDGKTWSYNPRYFATPETAAKVAAMVGGTVVEQNEFCPTGPLVQSQSNEMVQLSSGRVINAGEFVSFFTHGYPQYYVDHLVQQELKGEVG
jgi:hypothetical protein